MQLKDALVCVCMVERYRDWLRLQLHLGLRVQQLTGDREANWHHIEQAHIIMYNQHAH